MDGARQTFSMYLFRTTEVPMEDDGRAVVQLGQTNWLDFAVVGFDSCV